MRRILASFFFLALPSVLFAQQAMNNDSVLKLVRGGLSDDLIVTTINSAPGAYNISPDGLIALKSGGASDKIVAAIVAKSSAAQTPAPVLAPPSNEVNHVAAPKPPSGSIPRVFLQSSSKGNQWAAARDQSMEMSKDIEKSCPGLKITLNQNMADYTIALNHIEVGFSRDNQIQVANHDGDLISKTKEGGSFANGIKKACGIILDDWAKTTGASSPIPGH
jgi:hypothetical protein